MFLVGAVCLLAFGYQAYRYLTFDSRRPGPTGEVLADLEEIDHIPLEHGAAKGFNVIVISLDTTRADHLECYGNTAIRTPNLNAMAENGVLFANAFTPSPSTLPGHSSIFTGLYPYHHGARANGTFKLDPSHTTLAEILKQQGYNTCGAIGAYVLDSRFGIGQGFDQFYDDLSKGKKWAPHMFRERPAEYTNEVIFEWLEEHAPKADGNEPDSPFFMWIHYFDAHAPYMPAEPFRSQYAKNLYDGEIAYVDANIGNLLAKLDGLGVRDNTLIVVAGDHGEGLGEHGEQTHSLLTYDATLHTPLIFHSPKLLPNGHVIRKQVCNVDIAPTILDLLGVDSDRQFDGVSLARDSQTWHKGIYFETIATAVLHGWAPLFGVRHDDLKYIHAPTPEIYDLKDDPRELVNLFTQRTEQAVALSKELDDHIGDDPFRQNAPVQLTAMDPAVAKSLKALGYVGSKAGDDLNLAEAAKYDPKDMVPHWERITKAENQIAAGEFNEGVAGLEECLEEVPDDVYALRNLGSAYITMGKLDEAEKCFTKALSLEKRDSGIYLGLARVYVRQRKFDQAEEALDKAEAIDPLDAAVWGSRGALAANRNQPAKAEEYYLKAIEMDPGTTGPNAYVQLGQMYMGSMQLDKAREAFEKAIELDNLNPAAHSGMADVLISEDKLDEAEQELKIAVRFDPNQPYVLATLASLYDKKHDFEQARSLVDRSLAINENSVAALNVLGLIEKHTGHLDKAMELFRKALEIQPLYLASNINLAQCHAALDEKEQAVKIFEKVLARNPNVPIALANVGVYHATHNRPQQAIRFLTRAVRVQPDYALAHSNLGALLMEQGKPKQAIFHLRRGLELDPDQQGHEAMEHELRKLERAMEAATQPAPTEQPAETSP
jgi:arylsulfatase A-like enzyme/Tfp pilus assembly protein PilF